MPTHAPAKWLGLGPVAWLQGLNLVRFGAGLGLAMGLSRGVQTVGELAPFETLWLLHTLLAATLHTSLANHFLAAFRKAGHQASGSVYAACSRIAWATGGLASVVVAGVGFVLLGPTHLGPILLTSLFAGVSQATLLTEYHLWVQGKFRQLAVWGGANAAAQLALLASFPLGCGLGGVFWGLGVWALLRLGAYIRAHGTNGAYEYGSGPTLQALSQAQFQLWLPLLGVAVLGGSAGYFDALWVRHYCPPTDFVLFRYATRELPITLILANGLSAALSAQVAAEAAKGPPTASLAEARRRSLRLMHVCFPLSGMLLLGAGPLFSLAYSDAFQAGAPVFALLLLLVVPRMLFPQSILLGLQANRVLFGVSAAEWVLHIALSCGLVATVGMIGAAWATLGAYCLEKALLVAWLWRKAQLAPSTYIPLAAWAAYSLALIGLWVWWWAL
jgi:hypothetical protein